MINDTANAFLIEALIVSGFFLVLFVSLVLPQLRRLRSHRDMLSDLAPGDAILTNGGLIGKVIELDGDETAQVEFAPNIVMRVKTNLIYGRL